MVQTQRFTPPRDTRNEGTVRNPFGNEQAGTMPKPLPFGRYLREIKSGTIHHWNEHMAARSDLVELYEPASRAEQVAALAQMDHNAATVNPFQRRR